MSRGTEKWQAKPPAPPQFKNLRAWVGQAVGLPMAFLLWSGIALAHGVAGKDALFLKQVTGYDHLLFLFGVIFFLYRLKDVAAYVTCFAIGHSVTLLTGVLSGIHVNSFLVDALIGLSVAYKAFDWRCR